MNLFFILWISISSLLAVLLSLMFGSLSAGIALFSLAAAGLGSAYMAWQEINPSKFNVQSLFFLLFLGLFSFQFTYLLYEIRFDELWLATINPNNRGDLPFHINMIRAFARGLEFWPDHLFLITDRLRYPFGMNLFNAQFEILGISLSAHLMAVGLLCLALLIYELYAWLGMWGLICFFFSGGMGSYLPGGELAFKNLYLSVFVTQRGFLWALPAGIWLIRNFSTFTNNRKKTYAWIFILAIMPFFHLHSFFFLFIYFLGLHLLKSKNIFPKELAVVFLLASPWLMQAVWKSNASGIVHLSQYWLSFQNFGTWGALVVIAYLLAIKRKKLQRNDLWILFLSLLFSVVMLAPWDWDQIKILIWCYLLLNAVIAEKLTGKMSFPMTMFIAALVFYPGFLQVWQSMPAQAFSKDRVFLAKISEIKIIREKLKDIHPGQVVIAAPVYNHPLFFAGQSVVVGYPGHIWSQGAQSEPALDFLENAVRSGNVPDPQPFARQAVWILSSPYEKEKWPASTLFSHEDWSLFCVKPGHCQ